MTNVPGDRASRLVELRVDGYRALRAATWRQSRIFCCGSTRTVETARAEIYRKLGLKTRAELVQVALRRHMIGN